MEKISILLLSLLLCSCSNNIKTTSCSLYEKDNSVTYTIESVYDDIKSIKLTVIYKIPYNVLLNDSFNSDLIKQINDTYHFEDNLLIQNMELELNDKYSLSKTTDYLLENRYACRWLNA